MNQQIRNEIHNIYMGDLNQFWLIDTPYNLAIEIMAHRSAYMYRGEFEYTMADVRAAERKAKRGIKPGSDLFDWD